MGKKSGKDNTFYKSNSKIIKMKSHFTSFIKTFFRFRYPMSLIEPAYFWLSAPKPIKWFLAFRPLSLLVFSVPFFRNIFFKKAINERIVENAFVLSKINKTPCDILDFGTTSSWISLQLASLGHRVIGVDLRSYEFSHPNLDFKLGDIFETNLPDGHFDFVLIVSTLEHVRTNDNNADKEVLKILSKYLKHNGKMIITVPYGMPITLSSHRVYSKDRISQITPEGFLIKEINYFKKISDTIWLPSSEDDVKNADSSKVSNAVCCFVLEKN